jgi:omega-6 fatty acid desaturase (delta-12 desaturase)
VTQSSAAAEASSEPSLSYAVAAAARNGAFYLAALAAVPAISAVNPWWSLVAAPFLGLAMYRLTIVMHDCVHGTLFASSAANRWCGLAMGAMSGIEFHAFSRLHWLHHWRPGEPDDPQGADYLLLPRSRGGVAWHLLRPLVGYNAFKLRQVIRELPGGRRQAGRLAAGLLPVVAVQGCAGFVASSALLYWWLAPLPALSALTFGLFFSQLRGFAEHAAMPGERSEGCVRSHRPTALDRMILYDLNFNYHREHHLHPAMPSCRLPQLHRRLAAARPAEFALAPGMFGAVRSRLAAARRDCPAVREGVG